MTLNNEVIQALESIDKVVTIATSGDLTHHDGIEMFREMVTINADIIEGINKKL